MSGRSPIFSAKVEGELIGYVEGSKAFDKFGHLRCRYDEPSGNLSDLTSGKVVGHVSLEGIYGPPPVGKRLLAFGPLGLHQSIRPVVGALRAPGHDGFRAPRPS